MEKIYSNHGFKGLSFIDRIKILLGFEIRVRVELEVSLNLESVSSKATLHINDFFPKKYHEQMEADLR